MLVCKLASLPSSWCCVEQPGTAAFCDKCIPSDVRLICQPAMLVHVVLCSGFQGRMDCWSHFCRYSLYWQEKVDYGQIWKWPCFSLELSNFSSAGGCLGSSYSGWGELSLSSWHLQKPARAAQRTTHFPWLTLCSPALSCSLPSPRWKSVYWSCFPQHAASVGCVPSRDGRLVWIPSSWWGMKLGFAPLPSIWEESKLSISIFASSTCQCKPPVKGMRNKTLWWWQL